MFVEDPLWCYGVALELSGCSRREEGLGLRSHVAARIRRAGPTTSKGTMASPITTGHMTNYDGWNKFEEQAEDDADAYELVEVRTRPSPHRSHTVGGSAFPASFSVGSAVAFLHPSCAESLA